MSAPTEGREAALAALLTLCGSPRLRRLDDEAFEVGFDDGDGSYSGYFHPIGTSIPSPAGMPALWMTNGSAITPLWDEVGVLAHNWGLVLVGNQKGILSVHIVDFPNAPASMAHAVRSVLGLGLECCLGYLGEVQPAAR